MRNRFVYKWTDSEGPHSKLGDIGFLLDPKRLIEVYEYFTTTEFENDDERPLFPANFLPVGNDAGQGKILLKLDEPYGSVWYWPEREWAWGTEDNTWLGFVADDFYAFVNAQQLDPP